MKTHHKSSKRQKLSTKYNLKKKIREHRRRLKKEAKRLNLGKRVRKDPGIPNSWPFKAEMLAELEAKKEKRDAEIAAYRIKNKNQAVVDHKQLELDRKQNAKARDEARAEKQAAEAEKWQAQALRRVLPQAEVLLQVLDLRDPLACRCAALEKWALEQKKRVIFVLSKADLVTPATAAKWLLLLGKIAPTVVVQAEAGREGIRDLLALLGHLPAKDGNQKIAAAKAVGVLGYAGSGKRALCKAIRQEIKTTAAWLLDAVRLRPGETSTPNAKKALHAVICNSVPRGAANATSAAAVVSSGSIASATSGVDPIDVVKEFLTRVPIQSVLRHFRLPAFEGVEGFLKAFGEDRKVKGKKGKPPKPAVIADRILAEMSGLPGCFGTPPEEAIQSAQDSWSLHATARQHMEAVMQQQVATLSARGVSGPAAAALGITSSAGPGPTVDIEATLIEGEELVVEGEDDVSDSDLSSDDEMDDGSLDLESGEEEEGEESEEEMSDDE